MAAQATSVSSRTVSLPDAIAIEFVTESRLVANHDRTLPV